jgi:prolipoprotein diacylglyceryltransferase
VYTHARSRVVRLSQLGGTPLHPTQLYSIVSSLVIGALLARLWTVGASLPFIAGAYFMLVGLTRFVEEHYRGEPQTVVIGGLRLYQWLALSFVIGGAALTCIAGAPAPAPTAPGLSVPPPLLAVALVTYAAYGIDFPRSTRRFSRLV